MIATFTCPRWTRALQVHGTWALNRESNSATDAISRAVARDAFQRAGRWKDRCADSRQSNPPRSVVRVARRLRFRCNALRVIERLMLEQSPAPSVEAVDGPTISTISGKRSRKRCSQQRCGSRGSATTRGYPANNSRLAGTPAAPLRDSRSPSSGCFADAGKSRNHSGRPQLLIRCNFTLTGYPSVCGHVQAHGFPLPASAGTGFAGMTGNAQGATPQSFP